MIAHFYSCIVKPIRHKHKKVLACLLAVSLLTGLYGCGGAGNTSFTAFKASPDAGLTLLSSKIDKQYVQDIADKLAACADLGGVGYCTAGSASAATAANIINDEMKKIGLSDIKKQSFKADSMYVSQSAIEVKTAQGTSRYSLGLFPSTSSLLAGGQPYEVAYCGKGTKTDYGKVAMAQKVALVICDDRSVRNVEYIIENAKENGAIGVIIACSKTTDPDSSAAVFSGIYPSVSTGISAFSMSFKDASYLATLCNNAVALSVPPAAKTVSGSNPAANTTVIDKAVMVTFDLQYNSLSDQTAYNISGLIRGTDPHSAIVVGCGYDHLLQGYNENCVSTAMMLGLAKALKDSGYVTQRSIIFAAYSASSFAKIGDPFSVNDGLQYWLSNTPKSYPKNILYSMYIDMPSINLGDTYPLAVSIGMAEQISHLTSGLNKGIYKNGVSVSEICRSDCPQFIFGEQGIPSVGLALNNTPASDIIGSMADNKDNFNSQAFDFSAKLYAKLLTGLDQTVLLPVSFSPYLRYGASLLLGDQKQPSEDISPCYNTTLDVADSFERLNDTVNSINDAYASAVLTRNSSKIQKIYNQSASINAVFKEVYRRIQTGCTVMDYNSALYYSFMPGLKNTTALSQALSALRKVNPAGAIANLNNVDTNFEMQLYSSSVCQNIYNMYQSMSGTDLFYAFKRTYQQANIFSTYASIGDLVSANKITVKDDQIHNIGLALDDQKRELKIAFSAWRTAVGLSKTRAETVTTKLNDLANE